MPNVSALVSYLQKSNEITTNVGAGVDFKTLQPLLTTTKNNSIFVTSEKVAGLSATAYFKRQSPNFTIKLQGVYGENLFELIMLGGYAVHNILDTTKNTVSYTTLNQFTAWGEFQTNGKNIQFGLWAGYSQNLGSKKSIFFTIQTKLPETMQPYAEQISNLWSGFLQE
ncbi:MAG: hypothetical protein CVT92_14980 [Bacteroidetes bacterium HGW-Bacteroidetes-1]|jgi:hypothetical protein|nr:MAG: hypothetical protein CVT92_14980 [Bacteroidetes bacterium HGW-Bacteroidetes-1]